jgi:hypothetical protein
MKKSNNWVVKTEFQKPSFIVYARTALFENREVEKIKNLDTLIDSHQPKKN